MENSSDTSMVSVGDEDDKNSSMHGDENGDENSEKRNVNPVISTSYV